MAENGGRRSGLRACGAAAAGGLTAVLLGVLGTAPAMAAPTVGRARAGTTPAATRTVTYSGYRVRVPASWPVYDLAADPSQCVLFNRHAVYLGTPGGDQRCPARAFGRTEALLIQPDGGATALGGALPAGTVVLPRNSAALPAGASTPAPDAVGHVLRVVAPGPGVLVTASYGRDAGLVRSILAGAATTGTASSSAPATSQGAATPGTEHSGSSTTYRRAPARRGPSATASPAPVSASPAPASASPAPASASPAPASPGPSAPSAELAGQQGSGLGFDTCTAPSAATMTSWLSSPYRVVGTYLGGVNWACGYGNFSAAWVSQVAAEGWRFIPIWVGLQAPCSTISGVATISAPQAAAEGQAEAASAVAAAQQFGYGAGSPVYFDMEGYSSSDTSCSAAVVTFLGAWTQGLHAAGYRSGVYSSASSGIAALAAQYGNAGYPSPDDIWIADWNGDPVLTDSAAPAADWPGRRLHQYYGAHDETWGGATVNVDNDAVGGEVAGLPAVRAGAPGAVTAEPGAATVAPGPGPVAGGPARGADRHPEPGPGPGLAGPRRHGHADRPARRLAARRALRRAGHRQRGDPAPHRDLRTGQHGPARRAPDRAVRRRRREHGGRRGHRQPAGTPVRRRHRRLRAGLDRPDRRLRPRAGGGPGGHERALQQRLRLAQPGRGRRRAHAVLLPRDAAAAAARHRRVRAVRRHRTGRHGPADRPAHALRAGRDHPRRRHPARRARARRRHLPGRARRARALTSQARGDQPRPCPNRCPPLVTSPPGPESSATGPPAASLGSMNIDDLPAAEFGFPGPLRDRLVAAILSGAKTATSSLMADYEHGHEPLPRGGGSR